ncbi:MAG: phospho-sugar mutase, partial [Cyclobacteriaceae bacterium]|nr:phospho-sugar mutase [Cyclobacteriaceae bacterium]
MSELLSQVKKKAQQWLDSPVIDQDTKNQIKDLLSNPDQKELIDSFYKDLEFGTGGLRGIMGAGSNCMNKYTVGVATQGLCNYLLKAYPGKKLSVALAHDSRNNSPYFTQIVADVFSANGIEVYRFA